jgi:hypothetical protein
MTDIAVLSATQTIGNWRTRRILRGRTVTDDDVRREVQSRWSDFSDDQVEKIVQLCKLPRDRRGEFPAPD